MFNQVDTSGDGSIDKSELAALSGESTSSLVDELFSNMDADQDSLISLLEFDSSLAKAEQQMRSGGSGRPSMSGMDSPPPPPEKVFDTADTNGDGSVSEDELTAVLGDKASDLFGKVDTDGDGVISRTEDETFRAKMDEQRPQGPPPDSVQGFAGSEQDWKSRLFEALVNGLTSADSTASESASRYA